MGDSENAIPSSKKRAAGREISRDNPGLDDEGSSDQETGTFKKASDEVLASRRIVKVRRSQTSSIPSANPFAGIRLIPPTETVMNNVEAVSSENSVPEEPKDAVEEAEKTVIENAQKDPKDDGKEEAEKAVSENVQKDDTNETEKREDKIIDKDNTEDEHPEIVKEATVTDVADANNNSSGNPDQGTPLSSFQQLSSSQNAFSGLVGTGFSTSTFSFGSIPKEGSPFGSTSSSLFGLSNNGNSSFFNSSTTSIASKNETSGFPPMQEVSVETGEENEKSVFSADSVLFEFIDNNWKERGKGELKVNLSTGVTEKARLVMRARGNYRLILNASLYPDMKLTNMDKRGITFACMNSNGEGKDGLSTFALKFKDASIVEEFRAAVVAHKDKPPAISRTPENSPKACDE